MREKNVCLQVLLLKFAKVNTHFVFKKNRKGGINEEEIVLVEYNRKSIQRGCTKYDIIQITSIFRMIVLLDSPPQNHALS